MTKICVIVKDGQVIGVRTNRKNAAVAIVSYDNIDRGESPVDNLFPVEVTDPMYLSFTEDTPAGHEIHHELKRIKF